MASTSRSLFLLSLLVAGFCMTATANRSLQETNKLSLIDLDTQLLGQILHSKHGLVRLVVKLDLSEVVELLYPVVVLLEDAAGNLVPLEAVAGLVTELKEPIEVKVTVTGNVYIVLKVGGKTVRLPLKVLELAPVLDTVEDVLHVVVKVVKVVEKEVKVVLQIVSVVSGEVLGLIKL